MPDDAEMAKASFSLVFTKQISCELVSDTINPEEEQAGKGQRSLEHTQAFSSSISRHVESH